MKSRNITKYIEEDLKNRWISVILGPRQVGKTTLLKQLHKKTGGFFLDLDIYSNFEKVSSYENFLRTLELNSYKKEQKDFFYVYLDEFQRYADLTKVLKNVYDHHENVKVLITGSSSLTIKNQIQESLAGRKRVFEMYPLSFEEFLDFKDRNDLLELLKNIRNLPQVDNLTALAPELYVELEEFMIYGGYPRVVLSPKPDKKLVIDSIFDSYIKKDLVDYLKLEKISNAKTLMELLAINHGSITNYNSYASVAGIDAITVKNYIEILNETFIIMSLRPFFKNKNKEISKNPKVYFIDSGARNYLINNFNSMNLREDAAFLFESFVISEFLKSGLSADSLKFYRTYTKVEVDLIIDLVHKQIPVEIKYKANCKKKDFSGLIQFIKEYNPAEALMINLGQIGQVDILPNHPEVKYLSCFDTKT